MLLNNPVWPESNYLCLVQRNDFIRYHCVARCLLFLAHFCTDNAALAEAPSYWPLLFYTSSKAPTFWQPTSLSPALLKWSCLQDGWRDLENKTPGRVSLFFFLNSVMQSSHSRPLSEALSRGRVYNQVCFSHFANSNMIRGDTVKGRIKPEEIATQSACKKETVAKFSAKELLFLQHEGNRNSLVCAHTHTHKKQPWGCVTVLPNTTWQKAGARAAGTTQLPPCSDNLPLSFPPARPQLSSTASWWLPAAAGARVEEQGDIFPEAKPWLGRESPRRCLERAEGPALPADLRERCAETLCKSPRIRLLLF